MNLYLILSLKLFLLNGMVICYEDYWWRYALSDFHYYDRRGSYGRYLRQNPSHGVFINNGIYQAVSECQRLFKFNRWNCVSDNVLKPFGDVVEKGCRETAFIYALTSASLTYEMIKTCSEGRTECARSCKKEVDIKKTRLLNATHTMNDACNDNLRFGFKAWNSIVFEGERSSDIRAMFNLKNSIVGLKQIEKSVYLTCRCMGASGSCILHVCARRVPSSFGFIGSAIYKLYQKATYGKPDQRTIEDTANYLITQRKSPNDVLNRIATPNIPQQRSVNSVRRKRSKMFYVEDLEFFELSPDFCYKSKYSQGIENRVCWRKVTSEENERGIKSCKEICCRGRGWRWIRKTVRKNCKFHYCCKVVCEEDEQWVKEFYCL